MFLPISRAESFEHEINKLSHERDEIETKYFKLRSDYTAALDMKDKLQVVAETYKDWKNKLESAKEYELASEITKMIDKN